MPDFPSPHLARLTATVSCTRGGCTPAAPCATCRRIADLRLARITVRAATFTVITVNYADLAAAWRKDQGIPDGAYTTDGEDEYPQPAHLEDRDLDGEVAALLTPYLGDAGDADLYVDTVTVIPDPTPGELVAARDARARAENPGETGPAECCQRCGGKVRFGRCRGCGAGYQVTGPDDCADAMRILHNRILSAVPPGPRREEAEETLSQLLHLTADDLSDPARAGITAALNDNPVTVNPDAGVLRAAAEILHDRGAPTATVGQVAMYADLAEKPSHPGGPRA